MIDYDQVFRFVYKDFGLEGYPGSKALFRSKLIERDGNDLSWQKVQARVYAYEITKAKASSGLIEFLRKNYLKHDLFIVSHKTEFSKIDPNANLREAALKWMERNLIFDFIKRDRVFFLSELDQKVKKIGDLSLDLFVDDLLKVRENQYFPKTCRFVLFSKSGNSESISDFSNLQDYLS